MFFGRQRKEMPPLPPKPGMPGKPGAAPSNKMPIGTMVVTGQSCPESGIWESQGTPSGRSSFPKGARMPDFNKKSCVWKLVRYP
jgi:hypothetical protein